jgi:Uma2 family endonuclease
MAKPKPGAASAVKPDVRYTVAYYRTWPDDERWELIDGLAYAMSPAPRTGHQLMVGELFYRVRAFLEGKTCQPFIAPVDVYLQAQAGEAAAEEDDSVVQPDVLAVCDPAKVGPEGIRGAPDFVAEVLSDSTANKDLTVKRERYERAGVREYWIVAPTDGRVLAWRLADGRYAPVVEYRGDEAVPSAALAGFVWPARLTKQ